MTDKRILGTGNFALDAIYQREYPEGFDTARKRNPFVDKLVSCEVGNTCGNVMCMLPYLGVETYPIGHFDESEQGLKIKTDLERYGANTRFVKNSKEGGTTLMTCVHKLDANGQHIMSHRATSPNSRFPKRKQLRKDEVAGFMEQLDFRPDAYFFDVSDAGPRELAAALKERGVLVYYEPEGNNEMNKFLRCVAVSDIIKFSGARIEDTTFVADYRDKRARRVWSSTCAAADGSGLPLCPTTTWWIGRVRATGPHRSSLPSCASSTSSPSADSQSRRWSGCWKRQPPLPRAA